MVQRSGLLWFSLCQDGKHRVEREIVKQSMKLLMLVRMYKLACRVMLCFFMNFQRKMSPDRIPNCSEEKEFGKILDTIPEFSTRRVESMANSQPKKLATSVALPYVANVIVVSFEDRILISLSLLCTLTCVKRCLFHKLPKIYGVLEIG